MILRLGGRQSGRNHEFECRIRGDLFEMVADIQKEFEWLFRSIQKEQDDCSQAVLGTANANPVSVHDCVSFLKAVKVSAGKLAYIHRVFEHHLDRRLDAFCKELDRVEEIEKMIAKKPNWPDHSDREIELVRRDEASFNEMFNGSWKCLK